MREYLDIIRDAVNGERAYTEVLEVTNFHRIQASTGYRAAAEHVVKKLQADGISCQMLQYPSDEKTWYWASKSFKEWDCKSAWCDLVVPQRKRIADFRANNIAVVQKSFPCDYSNTPLDVVMLDKGPDEAAYEGLDLKGKIVFIRDAFNPYMEWAFSKRGAVGFITDFMREVPGVRARSDLYDIRNYTSFWWKDTSTEPNIFGFVLTPRQGDELAALIRKMQVEHEQDASKPACPQVVCKVESSVYDGYLDVVEATLPGETKEEILIIAHLCHPRASANDNASGVSCAMEIVRVLKQLQDTKQIPPLKRGIRMILVPEFSGTYAWLAGHEEILPNILAGINLDMVGGRQTKGYGPLTICGQPHANPAIVTDAAALCLDEVKKNVPSSSQKELVPMFNSHVSKYAAGSDQFILDDPTVNIPTPMLGQWPDIAYHTAADTAECVDPAMLHKSASIGACYAYLLSNLDAADVPQVLAKTVERCAKDIGEIVSESLEKQVDLDETFARLEDYEAFYLHTCADMQTYFTAEVYDSQVKAVVSQYQETISQLFAQAKKTLLCVEKAEDYVYTPKTDCPAEYAYVPVRKYRGPIMHLDDFIQGNEDLNAAYKSVVAHAAEYKTSLHVLGALIEYYMDGKRSLGEIARLALLENRAGGIELVHEYVQLLVKYGIVEVAA